MNNEKTKTLALESGALIDEKEFMKQNRIPSMFEVIWKEIRRDPFALICLITLIGMILVAVIWGRMIDEAYIQRVHVMRMNLSPSEFGPLGTDDGGRPMLQMLVVSFRNSMQLSFMVTIPIIIIGTIVGLVIGYYGSYVDLIVMRIIDFVIMVPGMMVIAVFSRALPRWGVMEFALVMIILNWFGGSRGLRAIVLQEASKDYIMAAKTLGTPNIVIIFRKIFPNVLSFITINGILTLAGMIGFETGLTVIGFGLPIGVPSIGRLIALAMNPIVLSNRLWQWVPPVVIIFVWSICILGVLSAVSRAVNPRQRR